MIEKRKYERKVLELNAEYEWNGCLCPCFIADISIQGAGMRVRGCLEVNDNIKITIGLETIRANVVRTDGNFVGVKFGSLTEKQMNYILCLKMEMTK